MVYNAYESLVIFMHVILYERHYCLKKYTDFHTDAQFIFWNISGFFLVINFK